MLVGRIKPLDDLATSQRLGRSGPEPVADLIDHPFRRLPRLRVHGRLARTLPPHIHALIGALGVTLQHHQPRQTRTIVVGYVLGV